MQLKNVAVVSNSKTSKDGFFGVQTKGRCKPWRMVTLNVGGFLDTKGLLLSFVRGALAAF